MMARFSLEDPSMFVAPRKAWGRMPPAHGPGARHPSQPAALDREAGEVVAVGGAQAGAALAAVAAADAGHLVPRRHAAALGGALQPRPTAGATALARSRRRQTGA